MKATPYETTLTKKNEIQQRIKSELEPSTRASQLIFHL